MLTVIIGSTDRELEAHVRALSGRLITVPTAADLGAAVGRAQPTAVLFDLRNLPGVPPGLPLVRSTFPSAGIILLVDRLDPQLMLEAMRAGANEFLSVPVTAADLKGAIERLTSLPSAVPQQGKVLAFVGAKDGVGTTTLAVNVAAAIAPLSPGGVLMIDLHAAYGDAALFFGVEPRFAAQDALENSWQLDETYFQSIVVPTASGAHLLASTDGPRAGMLMKDRQRPWLGVDTQRLQSLLEFAAARYTHVVLDVPRSDGTMDALEPMSALVIVTNEELPTVRAAGRLASSLRLRYGKERVHVVVGRHDAHCDIAQADLERALGDRVRHVFPSDYRLAVASLNAGRPFAGDTQARLAGAVREFARSLAAIPAGSAPAAASSRGGLSRFRRR